MYALGHIGISLVLYAPIAAWYLQNGAVEMALLGGVLMAALGVLPDIDEYTELIPHRGPTHTVWFAIAVGAVVGLTAWALTTVIGAVDPLGAAVQFGLLGSLAILGHLAGDIITPMGVWPFRPLSKWHYTFEITPAKNPAANRLFFLVGIASSCGIGTLFLLVL